MSTLLVNHCNHSTTFRDLNRKVVEHAEKQRNMQKSTWNTQKSTWNTQKSTWNMQKSTWNTQKSTRNTTRRDRKTVWQAELSNRTTTTQPNPSVTRSATKVQLNLKLGFFSRRLWTWDKRQTKSATVRPQICNYSATYKPLLFFQRDGPRAIAPRVTGLV